MAVQFGNCVLFDLVANGLIGAGEANGAVGVFDFAGGCCCVDKIGFHRVAKRFWPGVNERDWRLFFPLGQIEVVVFQIKHVRRVFSFGARKANEKNEKNSCAVGGHWADWKRSLKSRGLKRLAQDGDSTQGTPRDSGTVAPLCWATNSQRPLETSGKAGARLTSPQSGYRLNCSRRNGFTVRFSVKEKDEAGQTAWLSSGLRKDAFCLHSPFVVGWRFFHARRWSRT